MKIKTTVLSQPLVGYKTRDLVWTFGLVLAAVVAPALLAHTPNNQWITGTIVNAILFVAAWRLGVANAILIAVLPSSIALMRGLLPAPMAMLIPYVIISNIILMSAFWVLKKKLLLAVVVASLSKFAFLYLLTLAFAGKLVTPLIVMLQWPQLFTAIAGGLLAIGAIHLISRKKMATEEVAETIK